MNLNPLGILTVSALLLAGCSSVRTHVDTGPIHARTFSFVNTVDRNAPEMDANRKALHATIQEAITKDLTAKGLTRTASGGDLTISYLVIVGNNAATRAIDDYFGFTDDESELRAKAQQAYTDSKNPNFFEAGTLLIDVVDSKSFKLLFRSYASEPILQNPTSDVRAARIQSVVDNVLKGLQIAR